MIKEILDKVKSFGSRVKEPTIIEKVKSFQDIVAELKKHSHYYPQILIRDYNSPLVIHMNLKARYASTLVRINRNDKWYKIHCVESFVLYNHQMLEADRFLLLKLMHSVYMIQNLFVVNEVDNKFADVDPLQISEEQRLKYK